jgi:hypothetical protein
MAALHARSSHWFRQGILRNLASFDEFEARVNKIAEEKERGDIFEIFIEGYMATQNITQRSQHWIVGNIPIELRRCYNLPKVGTGIDGIYGTRDGGRICVLRGGFCELLQTINLGRTIGFRYDTSSEELSL